MGFLQQFNQTFATIHNRINHIKSTERTIAVNGDNYGTKEIARVIGNVDNYSDFGLCTLGRTVKFPSPFISELASTNPMLANTVVADRINNYFEHGKEQFFAREFEGKICGVVSHKYTYFDDDQVADIIAESPLADKKYAHAMITPERLHLRAIDEDTPFRVNGDESDLFFAYFIDNSMVGQSSFKVQLGIYRLACTNGLIVPMKEFVICKQVHRGNKDISEQFNESIAFLDERKESIREMICNLGVQKASIEEMKEDFKKDYLAKQLNLSAKEVGKVLALYTDTYGGDTKWALVQAITEFARDTKNIDRRVYLEKKALKVA